MPEAVCPAGRSIGEADGSPGCVCAIEDHLVSRQTEPTTYWRLCTASPGAMRAGGYTACPTWQAEKQRIWAGRHKQLTDDATDSPARYADRDGVTLNEVLDG